MRNTRDWRTIGYKAKAKLQPLPNTIKTLVPKDQQKARRELRVSSLNLALRPEGVNVTFKEPIYKILEHIKNEPHF